MRAYARSEILLTQGEIALTRSEILLTQCEIRLTAGERERLLSCGDGKPSPLFVLYGSL